MVENKVNEGCDQAYYDPDCMEWFCEIGGMQIIDHCIDCEEAGK